MKCFGGRSYTENGKNTAKRTGINRVVLFLCAAGFFGCGEGLIGLFDTAGVLNSEKTITLCNNELM